jgi:hypothetical protein
VITSLALVVLATLAGTLASYLYDDSAHFAARLCSGACVGITSLGLFGFVFASFLGLNARSISLALGLTVLVPLVLLQILQRPALALADLQKTLRTFRQSLSHPSRHLLAYTIFYLIVGAILWSVFQKAMIESPQGIATGVVNNFGDLPFHISVITGFSYGNNFPPQDPTYAGVHFTYPFLTDFISAMFVKCGASLRQSMFLENFVVGVAFVGLMHRWAWVMLRDRIAALLTPLLVLLNGGFGWILLWNQLNEKSDEGFIGVFKRLSTSFTIIPDSTWRWGNAISTLLVPQRGFLLGLPLAVIVFTQWWLATKPHEEAPSVSIGEKKDQKKARKKASKQVQENATIVFASSRARMIAAGFVAGLLPLVHAHSFVVVMMVGAGIALLQRRWADWITFAIVASIVAVPQMWWSTHNSAVEANKFFEWHFGWDHGEENPVLFWLKNTGLFIPLTIIAILWRHNGKPLVSRSLLIFFLPFTLCFVVPNVVKLAPWIWDNVKVLFYWWLASAPLVALLLSRLWRDDIFRRALALVFLVCVTLAGALDVAAIVLHSSPYDIFTTEGIQFAELIKNETPPQSVIIHAPVHNHPVFLTGRRSLMGYPGHVWTHGLEFSTRESEIKRVYMGSIDAPNILRKYGVDYIVVDPLEKNVESVNDLFFSRYQLIGEVGGYRLYKVSQR